MAFLFLITPLILVAGGGAEKTKPTKTKKNIYMQQKNVEEKNKIDSKKLAANQVSADQNIGEKKSKARLLSLLACCCGGA